jgi:uncharacterized membrane protein YbhN (UPF0104 family)
VSEERPAPAPGTVAPSGTPPEQPASDTTNGPDPAAAAAPPSRRAALLRSGLILGVLFVVFVVILPRYIDYEEVLQAFEALTLEQFVVMAILGAIAWVVSGLIFSALVPGLSWLRGTASWLILSGIGASIPFGPWNMGVLWVVMRGWRIPNAPATSGIALYGVINILSRLFLPLMAVVALALTGGLAGRPNQGAVWAISIISIVVFVVVSALIVAIVRSERVADSLGRTGQRTTDWILRRLGRTGSPDVSGAIHRFRDQFGEVLRARGAVALALAVGSQIAWTIVLLVALRVCGVPESALTPGEVFAVYGLVMVITIIPLSPGGAGVPELLLISGFSTIAGTQYQSEITAGVFLYRAFYWFLPIPLAWILLKVVRRGKSMLPTTAELKANARGEPA